MECGVTHLTLKLGLKKYCAFSTIQYYVWRVIYSNTIKQEKSTLNLLKSKCDDRPKWVIFIFTIYALGFAAGTVSHILDMWVGGFLPYNSSPLVFNIYWTSLTFLDPLAIILLFHVPYLGMVIAVLIMVSDIAVNLYVTYVVNHSDVFSSWKLDSQIFFGVFVFTTVPIAWKMLGRSSPKTA